MDKNDIQSLIEIRQKIIKDFNSLRDYKNNPNAIMKEVDCARMIHESVVLIDKMLKEHVTFEDKK